MKTSGVSGILRRSSVGNTGHRRLVWTAMRSVFPSRRCFALVMTLLAITVMLRWVALGTVPLVPEEAYYWLYSQHPAMSYFDHPPMVAGVIGLGTSIFGDSEFGVRIIGNLLMIAASLLLYRFGRAWFDAPSGILAALMLHILPLYFGAGFVATMDPALLFSWMVCLTGITLALRQHRIAGWYLAGFGLGCALLSKYTGIFLVPGALLALALHPPWRKHLRSPHPYLGCLSGLMMFMPVIIWNARHDWASFRFQMIDRYDSEPLHLSTILAFFGIQILVATPAILWSLGYVLNSRMHHRRLRLSAAWIIALCFSLPIISMVAYKSLKSESRINWTLPAYLSLLPAIAHWYIARVHATAVPWLKKQRMKPLTASVLVCLFLNTATLLFLLGLQPRVHWISAFGPWERLAEIVEQHEDAIEEESGAEPLVIAEGKYRLASVLAFYRHPLETDINSAESTTSHWIFGETGLGFPYWIDRERWTGRDCLFVDVDLQRMLAKIAPYFESVHVVNDPRLETLGGDAYYIAVGTGLRPADRTQK
ncbi:MAG TPA: glycosyltransferase family 39 protein [bacterium]|nr:glycosyltransferase family 39 protein [bacterium]